MINKGPNFALSQKISRTVVLEAEKGVERLTYAKRWKDAMTKLRRTALAPVANCDAVMNAGRPEPSAAYAGRIVTGSPTPALTPPALGAAGGDGAVGDRGSTSTSATAAVAAAAVAATGTAGIHTGGVAAEAGVTTGQQHSSRSEPTSTHTPVISSPAHRSWP